MDLINKYENGLKFFMNFDNALGAQVSKIYDKSSPFRAPALQFGEVHSMANEAYRPMVDKVSDIKKEFYQWLHHFDGVRDAKKNWDQTRFQFDHYSQKLEELKVQ